MDDDYMAMFNASVDANIMILKQKKIILDQDAEIEKLRNALSAIALSHNNTIPPEGLNAEMMWIGCAQIARSALHDSHAQMSDDKGQR